MRIASARVYGFIARLFLQRLRHRCVKRARLTILTKQTMRKKHQHYFYSHQCSSSSTNRTITFCAPFQPLSTLYFCFMFVHVSSSRSFFLSALDSGASGPGSSPGRGHCVVFLGKTLYSHGVSLRQRCINGYRRI